MYMYLLNTADNEVAPEYHYLERKYNRTPAKDRNIHCTLYIHYYPPPPHLTHTHPSCGSSCEYVGRSDVAHPRLDNCFGAIGRHSGTRHPSDISSLVASFVSVWTWAVSTTHI